MESITLNIFGEKYNIKLEHGEFSLAEALSCVNSSFRVKSPLDEKDYEVPGFGLRDLLELQVIEARSRRGLPVGNRYVPSVGEVITIDYHVESEIEYDNSPCTVANKFGELATAEEYIGFHEILDERRINLWNIRLDEARELVTKEELNEANKQYNQRQERQRKKEIELFSREKVLKGDKVEYFG